MQVGNLVKHITQDKWGIILEIVDFTDTGEIDNNWIEVLWNDEKMPFWVWDDLIKVVG